MSIYATLWDIKVRKNHAFDDEWIGVYAQAVPAHIGHPSNYPNGDPYADFLPPVVEYDPNDLDSEQVERAVVILAEGRDEKIGQRYVEPLLILTGSEYRSLSFDKLMQKIEELLPWNRDICGMYYQSDGTKRLIRRPEFSEHLQSETQSIATKVLDSDRSAS